MRMPCGPFVAPGSSRSTSASSACCPCGLRQRRLPVADDGAADVALPPHRHVRRNPVRRQIADCDDTCGDGGADAERGDQADAVDPAAVTLLLAEQRLGFACGLWRKHQPPARHVASCQPHLATAVDPLQMWRCDAIAPAARPRQQQRAIAKLGIDDVRMGASAVVQSRAHSDRADVERVRKAFRFSRRVGGRLGKFAEIDGAVQARVADHERPIAIAPVRQPEPQCDYR